MKKFVGLLLSLIVTLSAVACAVFGVGYADTSVDISAIKDTYKIKTGIIGYPTVTTFVNDKDQLDGLSGAEKTPAMAFLRVKANDDDINVVDKSGTQIYRLYDCLANKLGNKIIPAFYVQAGDTITAQKICEFIEEYSLTDCVVVSSDSALLNSVYYFVDNSGAIRQRGIGCMLEVLDAKNKTHVQLSEMAASAGARAVIISADTYTEDEYDALRNEYTSTALNIYFKAESVLEVFKAISCGADGVCVNDYSKAISVYESFTTKTVIRPINLQAHRGTDVINQENTLESIYDAALSGTTTIEIDPRLTKDKQIVLCHDPTVERVSTGNGAVKDYTLQELKAMKININGSSLPSKFCSLEDVFIMYEKYGFKVPLVLDAKETDPDYIQILKDLIDEYDAWDIIASIGIADSTQREEYKRVFDDKISFDVVKSIPPQDLIDDHGDPVEVFGGDIKKVIKSWVNTVNTGSIVGGSVAPFYNGIVKSANVNAMPQIVREMNDRAIKVAPYQFDYEAEMLEAFYLNLRTISTGNAVYFSDYLSDFNVTDVVAKKRDSFNVTGICSTVKGVQSQGWANGLVVVEGENIIAYENGSFVAKNNGTAKVMFYTIYNNGKVNYARYSNIVNVTIDNAQRTDNVVLKTDANVNNGFDYTILIVFIVSFIVICVGVVIMVILLKRRK